MKKSILFLGCIGMFFFNLGYAQDGNLDTSFGNNGYVITDIENTNNSIFDAVITESDKIIVCGYKASEDSSQNAPVLTQYLSNGEIDTSFGVGGFITESFNGNDFKECDFNILSNNKVLIVANFIECNGVSETKLLKLEENGNNDVSFGNNGVLDLSDPFFATNNITMLNSSFMISGNYFNCNSTNQYALKKYLEKGELDLSFGNNGVFSSNIIRSNGILFQNNGKIISYGSSIATSNLIDFVITRINNDKILNTEEEVINSLKIYPNPSKETFNINFQNLENDLPYQVVDVTGKIIVKGIFTQLENNLNLSQVKTGVYFLKVGDVSYKLIKQ